jgi:hypothetical protein
MRLILRFALVGVSLGVALFAIFEALRHLESLPVGAHGIIERLEFRLCPLSILGFAPGMTWAKLIPIVLLSNALLYGAIFGMFGILIGLLRARARKRPLANSRIA